MICSTPRSLYDKTICGLPLLGIASVVGGFLLQFTMGTFYSFGNIMTYLVSYMREHGAPSQVNTSPQHQPFEFGAHFYLDLTGSFGV